MQAVCFFAVIFFAKGYCSVRGGFFCRGGRGFPGWQSMAGVFCGGGLRKCKPFVFLR